MQITIQENYYVPGKNIYSDATTKTAYIAAMRGQRTFKKLTEAEQKCQEQIWKLEKLITQKFHIFYPNLSKENDAKCENCLDIFYLVTKEEAEMLKQMKICFDRLHRELVRKYLGLVAVYKKQK